MKATELSHRLGLNAEAVCRHYLSNGHKAGRYWLVGNAQNEKGKSLFVRLAGPGIVGNWSDAASDEYGDLLDVIQLSRGLPDMASAMAEARRFLGDAVDPPPRPTVQVKPSNRSDKARRLYAACRPLAGTLGETYLNKRGIALREGMASLPGCQIQFLEKLDGQPEEEMPPASGQDIPTADPDSEIPF